MVLHPQVIWVWFITANSYGPKLSKGHFALNSFTKMRVMKAAQVLSYTVAAGIYTYTSVGELPTEAIYTAEFTEKIDKLFDAFNCRCFIQKQVLKRPMSQFFLIAVFHGLKVWKYSRFKNVLCIKGWILNINCLLQAMGGNENAKQY